MRINHGRARVAVPQQLLHCANVGAALKQMRGKEWRKLPCALDAQSRAVREMEQSMCKLIASLLLLGALTEPAVAAFCDYTPSKLVGAGVSGSVATGAGATAVAGVGLKAAGFYTITHAVTGATMLASTAGGASAAGTVGIMGGTAGAIGSIGAVLMSPFVIVPAAIVAGGVAAYEGGCYIGAKK